MTEGDAALEFRILGPLEARRDGEVVALGAPKQRALLAILLLRAGEVVSTDRLIDELWGETPPRGAAHTVQVFVSRLRKAVGADALVTQAPGYLIRGEVDAARFRALCAAARVRREGDESERALMALKEALALWRGSPLADFAYEPFAAPHIERLEEERVAANEDRLELELELGHHARLVGELEELCHVQPLRERPHALLMLALYRSARQSEALEVYRQLRGRLDEELGLEPAAELQALERRILQQDTTLEAAKRTPRRLPEGTVTFLFTDIEGSTGLLRELGAEAYAEALAEHRRMLRDVFEANDGVEVDTQGDAFFVAFPTVPSALTAAAEAQAALAIPVRMGVHTGTPMLAGEGYVGLDVHRAARIAAAGHGGQVLVSASTAALADGLALRDLGEHRFKDLAAPERVYQLGAGEFEPLESLFRTNLPVPATPFLGRVDDLAALVDKLRQVDVRLLTLTGPGGTGKTRLALQAAAETADEFPDGMTWIPLAGLSDPALALPTVAQAVGLQQDGERPLEDVLASWLAGKQALLLLDNAEHLLPGLAADVASLRDIEGPTLLVTSRERLQLQGEHVCSVPSLTRPDAVALFTARAAELGIRVTDSPTLDSLCEQLDDLPLALELAAARTRLFTPEQLLERIGSRLDLLKGGRDADPRQLTLRATIEWSHDLLDDAERTLFRGFSVFAGGSDYDAVASVCGGEVEVLQSLLDKSLLRRRDSESGPRYWMLETIREFAAELLAGSAEAGELKERHARYYAELAAVNAIALRRYDDRATKIVATELSNLRLGLATALAGRDSSVAARYLYGLWFHWLTIGLGREAATATNTWLGLDAPAQASDRFAGLLGAGEVLRSIGDAPGAIEPKRLALAIALADPEACVSDWPIGRWVPGLITDLAHLLLEVGEEDEARELAEEAVAIRRDAGAPAGIAHALSALIAIEESAGHYESAYELLQEALLQSEAAQMPVQEIGGLRTVSAELELLLGRNVAAAATLAKAMSDRKQREPFYDAALLRVGAFLTLSSADPERAALLFAAAETLAHETGVVARTRAESERDEAATTAIRRALTPEALNRATKSGRDADVDLLLDDLASWLALASVN